MHVPQLGTEMIKQPQDLFEMLDMHGVLLIRDENIDITAFTNITDVLGHDFMVYQGATISRPSATDSTGTILSVTSPEYGYAIPLHGEMRYLAHPPELLFFYCQTPAKQGGETTFCDAIALWQALPGPVRQRFSSTPITYIRCQGHGMWRQLYHTESLETVKQICMANGVIFNYCPESDAVTTHYTCSAVVNTHRGLAFINNFLPFAEREMLSPTPLTSVVRFADDEGHPISSDLVRIVRDAANQLTIAHAWQCNDIMVVDNHTVLHGRASVNDLKRRVLLRMARSRH